MITLSINLFPFDELSGHAQGKAITEHREFMLDTLRPDYIDGVCDWKDSEKMAMYNEEYDYIAENDEPVIENIRTNNYLFFYDGCLCDTTEYTGNHPKAGFTLVTIHGETDLILTEETK